MGLMQKGSNYLGIPSPILMVIIAVLGALLIVGIISLIIGLLGFIGLICLLMSGYIFITERKIKLAVTPFWILFGVGLFLVIGSQVGVLEIYQLDLSVIPGLPELNAWASNL